MSTAIATKPTRFAMYGQALDQLQEASELLDQARASMKDAQVDDVRSGRFQESPTIKRIIQHIEGLIKELQVAECDDCGHRLALHGDPYGCEHERGGDVPTRLCSCEWGLEAAGGVR